MTRRSVMTGGRRVFGTLVVLCVAWTVAAAAPRTGGEADTQVSWLQDWNAALREAGRTNRLLLVDFYTSWCTFCGKLEKETLSDPRVVELSGDFVRARLDADVQKAAAARYHPEGFPTVVFATPSGEEILQVSGFRPADQFVTILKAVKARGPEIAELLERIRNNPKDAQARKAVGETYVELGAADMAVPHLNAALKSDGLSPAGREETRFLLARAAMESEEYRRAVKLLGQLVEEAPESDGAARYYLELGRAYIACGKKEKAARVLGDLARKFPGSDEARVARGLLD